MSEAPITSLELAGLWYSEFLKYLTQNPHLIDFPKLTELPTEKIHHPNIWMPSIIQTCSSYRLRQNYQKDKPLEKAISKFITEQLDVQESTPPSNLEIIDIKENGYGSFSALTTAQADKLNDLLNTFDLKPYPNNPNLNSFDSKDLLKNPLICYKLTSPIFLKSAYQYLGVAPLVANLSAWDSLPNQTEAKAAQQFHLDLDDFAFCKGFIYLTDTDENAGPHTYFPRSHDLNHMLKLKLEHLDKVDEFTTWFNDLRKSDEDCEYFLKEKPVMLTGKKGTGLLVDTCGVHKGLLPKHKDRRIIQALYAVTPNTRIDMPLTPFSQFIKGYEHLVDHFLDPMVRYSLMLYIDYAA